MAYSNPNAARKTEAKGPAPAGAAVETKETKKRATHSVLLCDAEGEIVTWEDVGADFATLTANVKKFGDQKNASVGAIWMAESGKSGFLKIGDLTLKIFLNTPKDK